MLEFGDPPGRLRRCRQHLARQPVGRLAFGPGDFGRHERTSEGFRRAAGADIGRILAQMFPETVQEVLIGGGFARLLLAQVAFGDVQPFLRIRYGRELLPNLLLKRNALGAVAQDDGRTALHDDVWRAFQLCFGACPPFGPALGLDVARHELIAKLIGVDVLPVSVNEADHQRDRVGLDQLADALRVQLAEHAEILGVDAFVFADQFARRNGGDAVGAPQGEQSAQAIHLGDLDDAIIHAADERVADLERQAEVEHAQGGARRGAGGQTRGFENGVEAGRLAVDAALQIERELAQLVTLGRGQ